MSGGCACGAAVRMTAPHTMRALIHLDSRILACHRHDRHERGNHPEFVSDAKLLHEIGVHPLSIALVGVSFQRSAVSSQSSGVRLHEG